jgi:hypothetical protein
MEPEDVRTRQGKSRERRLTVISRGPVLSLCKFLELASKYIVHFERLGDFPSDIAIMSSPGMQISFLQQNQVRRCSSEEINYLLQQLAAIDVPAYDPDGIRTRARLRRFNE